MKLRLAQKTTEVWVAALGRARHREIGGILFGEHVGEADFRIIEATIHAMTGSRELLTKESGSRGERKWAKRPRVGE